MTPKMQSGDSLDKPPIHILSLDGGGVRGLSSLLILRELMGRISLRKNEPVRPCDCFQLIIGTGTGGISALFLGRMRMSVDQAIEEYIHVAEVAFKPKRSAVSQLLRPQSTLLDGTILEETIGEVIERIMGSRNVRLADSQDDPFQCHIAALSITGESVDAVPCVFRSYTDGVHPASTFTICEVARATASTAGLFIPFALGNPPMKFMDAGVAGYNNPAEFGLREAKQLWPERQIGCFVSLGTGLQRIVSLDNEQSTIADACRAIIENCEQVHDRTLRNLPDEFPYFRFNVDRGLDKVNIMEWSEAGPNGQLSGITDAYMRWKEVDTRLNHCVRAMSGGNIDGRDTSSKDRISNTAKQIIGKYLPIQNPPPERFYGRANDVENAVARIQRENSVRIPILGSGGIGKTSIALTLLHDTRIEEKFGEHRRFISCEGILSTLSLIETMCTAFGLYKPSRDPLQELLVYLTGEYARHPLLVVLDNFETVWDVEDAKPELEHLLRTLGSVKMLSLVVTMRSGEKPIGIRWSLTLHVGSLDLADARSTFIDVRDEENMGDGHLDELLQALDCVPLAVTLMARLGQNESPAELLERWKKEQTRLLSRPQEHHRLDSMDVSIGISINSYRMLSNPDALQLLGVISLLPSGVLLGQLPDICPGIPNLSKASATLREVALAYYDAARTLRVLSPIRFYTQRNHPVEPKLLDDLESYYFGLAKQASALPGPSNNSEAVDSITRNHLNIEAVILLALTKAKEGRHDDGRAVRAALDWETFLSSAPPRSTIIELAMRVARKQSEYDLLPVCLHRLGINQHRMGNHGAARETLMEAQAAYKAVDDSRGAAMALRSLGELQRSMADYPAARDTLTEALAWFKVHNDGHGVARCLTSIGEAQTSMHDREAAQETLAKARVALKAIDDRHGLARCLLSLGTLQSSTGDYGAARETFKEAHDAHEALDDLRGVAWSLWNLADIQGKTADYDNARDTLAKARQAFESMDYQRGVTECLRSLGELQSVTDDYDVARGTLTKARQIYETFDDRRSAAYCTRSLAFLSKDWGRRDDARAFFLAAKEQWEALGSWTKVYQDECSRELARLSS